jgi:hypothetical protein
MEGQKFPHLQLGCTGTRNSINTGKQHGVGFEVLITEVMKSSISDIIKYYRVVSRYSTSDVLSRLVFPIIMGQ